MSKINLISELSTKTGPLDFPLTNDFFFRALLQKNNNVLKGLIASLLHLNFKDIDSAIIKNETSLGELPTDKVHVLDISVLLNTSVLLDLEMQVLDHQNWPERSLSYLCRTFDNINKGDDYINVKPTIHIGILDFTLFNENPEFYANYYLMSQKTHFLYSDKFRLSVVDLTKINLATDEDKSFGIDQWAYFFKSNTWEELKMLAQENDVMNEAVSTTYLLSKDEIAQQIMRVRQESIAYENYIKKQLKEKDARIAELEAQLAEAKK